VRGIENVPWLYDAICAWAEWTGLARWRRWLTGGARGRTLDLGCGTGRNLPLLAAAGVWTVGVDPEKRSLERARRRAPRTPLVLARAEALPFRSASFDTVVSGLVFCSVGDPPRGLAEVRRVLRPEGTLRMLEHVRSTVPWKARVQDRIQPLWTSFTGGCHPNRDTERAVSDAGFVITDGTRRANGTMRRFVARAADTRG
jgi:ubiquinone/menaquinone biosynthesis C-methylase UbiE